MRSKEVKGSAIYVFFYLASSVSSIFGIVMVAVVPSSSSLVMVTPKRDYAIEMLSRKE